MPRYFFDIADGEHLDRDERGQVAPHDAAATILGARVLYELMSGDFPEPLPYRVLLIRSEIAEVGRLTLEFRKSPSAIARSRS